MIVEYIRYKLQPPPEQTVEDAAAAFEAAYRQAATSLDASTHCLGYELARCVEEPDRYILRIDWDSIDGHLGGFRKAPEFGPFFTAIKPYVGQIEEMQHYALTAVRARRAVEATA